MDRFHEKADRIYLTTIRPTPMSELDLIQASLFFKIDYDQYPGVDKKLSLKKYTPEEAKVVYSERSFDAEALIADSTFFDFFDFPLLAGDRENILADPGNIVLTRSFADKIFGLENPLGKTLTIRCDFQKVYTVAGIIEQVPPNSSIQFDFILPEHAGRFSRSGAEFLLVNQQFNAEEFGKKIAEVGRNHEQFPESTLSVTPFTSVYFDHHFGKGIINKNGDEKIIILFIIIAAIVLLISLLNFINLQTTAFTFRLKGIAINKVSGASWGDVIKQILVERVLMVVIASAGILCLYYLLLPYFNKFIKLSLPFMLVEDSLVVLSISSLFILLSVTISVLQLHRFNVLEAIRDRTSGSFRVVGKEPMIVFQYIFTIAALIASILVFRQLQFMLDKDLGFNDKNIISVNFFDGTSLDDSDEEEYKKLRDQEKRLYSFVLDEIRKSPDIEISSRGKLPFGDEPYKMPWKKVGEDIEYTSTNGYSVAPAFEKLLNLEIVEGRFFNEEKDASRQKKIVINEAAKKLWEVDDIGASKIANNYWGGEEKPFEIIGVVKDFHYQHLSLKVEPLVILNMINMESPFLLKIREGREKEALKFLSDLNSKVNPGSTFQYSFLDDQIRAQYGKEEQLSQLYFIFTAIALFISSIGLFTMSLYQAQKRVKEVGVRRVNGASISNVMFLLNKDFLKWVLLAFVLACPISWYAMDQWLQNFAYRTEFSWWIFALAGMLTLAVAIITVSWQSWRAASKNPVESLRYE